MQVVVTGVNTEETRDPRIMYEEYPMRDVRRGTAKTGISLEVTAPQRVTPATTANRDF